MPALKKAILFCFFLFLFLFPHSALAKIEIIDYSQEIEINKEFIVEVLLTKITGSHHIGLGLQKKSGAEYFGLTWGGHDWVEMEDSNCADLPLIAAIEGSWSGQLKGKVIYDEEGFDNSLGNYFLKVVKYTTASCGKGGKSKSYSDGVNVVLLDPNPPPSAPSSSIPSPASTSSPKPSPSPSPGNPSPSLRGVELTTTLSGEVLGQGGLFGGLYLLGSSASSSESSPGVRSLFFPRLFLMIGLVLLAVAGAWAYYSHSVKDKEVH